MSIIGQGQSKKWIEQTKLQLLTYVFVPRDIQSWFSSIFSRTVYATKTYNTSFESPDNGQKNS